MASIVKFLNQAFEQRYSRQEIEPEPDFKLNSLLKFIVHILYWDNDQLVVVYTAIPNLLTAILHLVHLTKTGFRSSSVQPPFGWLWIQTKLSLSHFSDPDPIPVVQHWTGSTWVQTGSAWFWPICNPNVVILLNLDILRQFSSSSKSAKRWLNWTWPEPQQLFYIGLVYLE